MAKSFDILRQQSDIIINETDEGKNTGSRVGGNDKDIVDKMEEIYNRIPAPGNFLPLEGGTMLGDILFNSGFGIGNNLASILFSGDDINIEGDLFLNGNAVATEEQLNDFVNIYGDTMYGSLILDGNYGVTTRDLSSGLFFQRTLNKDSVNIFATSDINLFPNESLNIYAGEELDVQVNDVKLIAAYNNYTAFYDLNGNPMIESNNFGNTFYGYNSNALISGTNGNTTIFSPNGAPVIELRNTSIDIVDPVGESQILHASVTSTFSESYLGNTDGYPIIRGWKDGGVKNVKLYDFDGNSIIHAVQGLTLLYAPGGNEFIRLYEPGGNYDALIPNQTYIRTPESLTIGYDDVNGCYMRISTADSQISIIANEIQLQQSIVTPATTNIANALPCLLLGGYLVEMTKADFKSWLNS